MVQCYGFVNRCQRISGTYFAVISRVISLIKIGILIVMANPVTPEKKGKHPTTFKDTYKNKTKERGNMSTSTLNSLMTHKLAMQNRRIKCHSALQ